MALDPSNPQSADLLAIVASFSSPNTRKITDYLNGYQLGPSAPVQVVDASGKAIAPLGRDDGSISYWTGDLLSSNNPGYAAQVRAIKRSFTFRNVLREGLELLADGIGADEADWSFVVSRPLGDGEKPTTEEQKLIDEIEAVATGWWDDRDMPSLIQRAVISGLAHGHQPLRPRLPAKYLDAQGRLAKRTPEQSLDPLWFVLPDVGDAGIWQDPDTMERYGLVRIWTDSLRPDQVEWEISSVDGDGNTVITQVDASGKTTPSQALPLGGRPWLLDLRMPRAMATADALGVQDSRNVGTTAMSRNLRYAAFEKTIFLGIEPPTDEDGRPIPLAGPGSESWLLPVEITETEDTGKIGDDGLPLTITRTKLFPGASVTKLDPAEPKAIQAAIDQATSDLYGILRQQFMLIAGDATASGRSRETSTGPYLRAVARCATAVEAFIRDILTLAMRVSAIVQGQPKRYDGLRVNVTCRQKIFEPSSDTLRVWMELQQGGVISMQTLRTTAGIADPDAERQLIVKEQATTPTAPTAQPPTATTQPPQADPNANS